MMVMVVVVTWQIWHTNAKLINLTLVSRFGAWFFFNLKILILEK
jgi:hypothetical protein